MGNTSYKLKGRECCICHKKSEDFRDVPYRYYIEGNWDGMSYQCNKCRCLNDGKLPGSNNNIQKALAKCRIGQLDKYISTGKAIIDQAVVSRVLGIDDLNIKNDNYIYYIDMIHKDYGKINVKGSQLIFGTSKFNYYDIWAFGNKRNIDCDTLICLGYDENRDNILKVWNIPNDESIFSISQIRIGKNSHSKYNRFLIDQNPYNDIYCSIMFYLRNKKYFGIEDIKKWLYIN